MMFSLDIFRGLERYLGCKGSRVYRRAQGGSCEVSEFGVSARGFTHSLATYSFNRPRSKTKRQRAVVVSPPLSPAPCLQPIMASALRLSTSTDDFSDDDDAGPSTPLLPHSSSNGINSEASTSALILVHSDEDASFQLEEEISADEASDDEDFFFGRSQSEALSPIAAFAYLLGPYLKLGAMLLPNTLLPLRLGLPALLVFAVLSVFARQIWYMLARYLRKGDMEDVIVSVFSKERRSEQWVRDMLRMFVGVGTGSLRVLLATIYFRGAYVNLLAVCASHSRIESLRTFIPFLVDTLSAPYRDALVTIVLALAIFPFCIAESLAWKRVVWISWCSIVTYIVWFGLVAFAHGQGALSVSRGWLRMGVLWEGISKYIDHCSVIRLG